MVQRTVLKVDLSCQKCKKNLLKAVTLEGVDKIEADATKGTLSVTGDADPYDIIVSARKAVCRHVNVVSVGPPPKPEGEKKDEKKDGKKEKKDDQKKMCHYPCTCWECQRLLVVPLDHGCSQPNPSCSIM